MIESIKENPALFSVMITLFFSFFFPRVFEENNARKKLSKWLYGKSYRKRYRNLLGYALNQLEINIDNKPIPSHKSRWKNHAKFYFRPAVYLWWFPISFAYPIMLLLFEWAASGTSGLVNDLPNMDSLWRWLVASSYVFLFFLSCIGFKKISGSSLSVLIGVFLAIITTAAVSLSSDTINAFLVTLSVLIISGAVLSAGSGASINFATNFGIGVSLGAAIGSFIGLAHDIGSVTSMTFILPIILYLSIFFGVNIGAAAGAAIGAAVGATVGIGIGCAVVVFIASAFSVDLYFDLISKNVYLTIFLSVLPLLNCLVDYLSWGISRWFLRHIASNEHILKTVIYSVLDVLFALLFLLMLAFLLPFILEWIIYLTKRAVHIPSYLEHFRNDPFGKGLGITGMFVTTLLPTTIHLVIALGAICLPIPKLRIITAKRLAKDHIDIYTSMKDMACVAWLVGTPILIIGGFFSLIRVPEAIKWVNEFLYQAAMAGVNMAH